MNKKMAGIALAIVVVLVGAAIWYNKGKNRGVWQDDQNYPSYTDQEEKPQPVKQKEEASWTGLLKESDAREKGNLMLVTDKNTIYIFTSRDYSYLVGKQVKVSYEGTLENFRLGDITEK